MGVVSVKMMVDLGSRQADVWLMSELSGVVYMMKRMDPRTEPWGTTQERGSEEERLSRHETEKDLSDRYDWNQARALSHIPNQEVRRWSRMESIVSKAASRSSRVRPVTCCRSIALMRWSGITSKADSVE